MSIIQRREQGFTLVELAIVLMIIGLLIGGILRGQEMLTNARLQATIKQVNSYTGAINTFRDTYDGFPGDLRTATNRLPGCTASNNCVAGNGNGIVGTPIEVWQGGQQAISTENSQFWKHLALAHLITGVEPSASLPIWGKSHPASLAPSASGFTVVTTVTAPDGQTGGATNASVMTGALVLRMHGDLASNYTEDVPAISPKNAAYIDRKMDDGMPQTGDVQSRANGNGAYVAACESATGYDASREDAFCTMSFLLNR
ncbi:MAG: hypothetical protein JWM96_267 [Alphaproteobacteria bacterium]|nr:hypothetical protein [Alphaproteobacteria bacterium]